MHPLDLQKTLEQLTAVLLSAMFVYLLLEVGFLRFRRRALVVGEAGACGIGLVVAAVVTGLLSLFGLAAGVWTDKGSKIFEVASKLQAGVVWLNTYNRFDATSPFGGVKESGFGREGGLHGLRGYLSL